jgi:hypothetical protein
MFSHVGDISRFGYHTTQETQAESTPLAAQEAQLIQNVIGNSDLDTEAAYFEHLEVGIENYFEVRSHILALLQVWDAMIDEKNCYDTHGPAKRSYAFMKAFLITMETIPGRVSIGSLDTNPTARSLPTIPNDDESESSQLLRKEITAAPPSPSITNFDDRTDVLDEDYDTSDASSFDSVSSQLNEGQPSISQYAQSEFPPARGLINVKGNVVRDPRESGQASIPFEQTRRKRKHFEALDDEDESDKPPARVKRRVT